MFQTFHRGIYARAELDGIDRLLRIDTDIDRIESVDTAVRGRLHLSCLY